MGQLGGEESEQLDRNMWAPEEEQEEEDQVRVKVAYMVGRESYLP